MVEESCHRRSNYTQQTSRFHVDLIGRRELNPQSGREPDHHQDACHNGKSTAFDHLAPLGMIAVFRPDKLAGNLHQGLLCHISGAMLLPVVCWSLPAVTLIALFRSPQFRIRPGDTHSLALRVMPHYAVSSRRLVSWLIGEKLFL